MRKALRLIRIYHDMTQSDAAKATGLSKSYISDLESGKKDVTLRVLERYSDTFEIPVSSLALIAEKAESGALSERTRVYFADKALKVLDWIADSDGLDDLD